jgi:hypothetical protein
MSPNAFLAKDHVSSLRAIEAPSRVLSRLISRSRIWTHERLEARHQIDAQNCARCKTFCIEGLNQNFNWVTPEGDRGPNYVDM